MSDDAYDQVREQLRSALGSAQPPRSVQQRIVRAALASRRARPSWRRLWTSPLPLCAVAAALLLVLAVGVFWRRGTPRWSVHSGVLARFSTETSGPSRPALPTWRTRAEPATFTLGGNHYVALAPRSRVRVLADEPARRAALVEHGRAEFRVAPLGQGKRFSVRTAQAEVEVVGTRFVVEVDDTCTHIELREGKIRLTTTGLAALAGQSMSEVVAPAQRTVCQSSGPERMSAEEQLMRDALIDLGAARLVQARHALLQYRQKYPRGLFASEALFHSIAVERALARDHDAISLAELFLARYPNNPRASLVRQWLRSGTSSPDGVFR